MPRKRRVVKKELCSGNTTSFYWSCGSGLSGRSRTVISPGAGDDELEPGVGAAAAPDALSLLLCALCALCAMCRGFDKHGCRETFLRYSSGTGDGSPAGRSSTSPAPTLPQVPVQLPVTLDSMLRSSSLSEPNEASERITWGSGGSASVAACDTGVGSGSWALTAGLPAARVSGRLRPGLVAVSGCGSMRRRGQGHRLGAPLSGVRAVGVKRSPLCSPRFTRATGGTGMSSLSSRGSPRRVHRPRLPYGG